MITADQILGLNPNLGSVKAGALALALTNAVRVSNLVDSKNRRLRYFVAQVFHETNRFTKWVEDMTYTTAQVLVDTWPTRFTLDPLDKSKGYAPDFLRNAEKLGNTAYADRYGNGGAATGDGYRYRGRGGFHLTFKDNYKACSLALYGDQRLVTNPEQVSEYEAGLASACWYWNTHGFNALADADSFTEMTRVISGSTRTAPTRLEVLKLVQKFF